MMSDDQNTLMSALPGALPGELPEAFVETAMHYSVVSIGQAIELLDRIQQLEPADRPAGLSDEVLEESRRVLESSLPPEALADLARPLPPLPEPGLLPPEGMPVDEEDVAKKDVEEETP